MPYSRRQTKTYASILLRRSATASGDEGEGSTLAECMVNTGNFHDNGRKELTDPRVAPYKYSQPARLDMLNMADLHRNDVCDVYKSRKQGEPLHRS